MAWETRIDRIAEGDVEKLCRLLQGRVTRVNEDENGWDLLVEFPPALETAFADLDPPLRRCVIQVKSTKSRRPMARVKLSNALTLAKDDLPCFTVLLTYPNGPDRFEAAYLQHVWGTPMLEALRRTRQAQTQGKLLHKQSVTLGFKAGDRHDENVITELLSAIDEIGPGYGEKKRKLRDAMGYEDGWGELTFTVAGEDAAQKLDDLVLGLRSELPIVEGKLARKRFGLPGPERKFGLATLSLAGPSETCALSLRRGDEELVWPGNVYKSLDLLPLKDRRVRFVAGPLTVVMAGDRSIKANWATSLDKPKPLDELISDLRFRTWMDGRKHFLSIWTERVEFKPIAITFDEVTDPNGVSWPEVLTAVIALARIVPAERRPADLLVSIEEIAGGLHDHLTFARLCGPAPHGVRLVMQQKTEIAFEEVTHILAPWAAQLGDYFLVAVVERTVSAVKRSDGQIDFETRDGRLLRGTAIRAADATDSLLAKEVRWAREQVELSHRRLLSFLPVKDGEGDVELTWDEANPETPRPSQV